jgi:hypothetical protein
MLKQTFFTIPIDASGLTAYESYNISIFLLVGLSQPLMCSHPLGPARPMLFKIGVWREYVVKVGLMI